LVLPRALVKRDWVLPFIYSQLAANLGGGALGDGLLGVNQVLPGAQAGEAITQTQEAAAATVSQAWE
jgi:hypothetical protein